MNEARKADLKVADVLVAASRGFDVLRRVGLDYELVTRLSVLAHEVHRAIAVRGASYGEVIEALRAVKW